MGDYSKHLYKYTGRPGLPGYKHKNDGFMIIFTNNASIRIEYAESFPTMPDRISIMENSSEILQYIASAPRENNLPMLSNVDLAGNASSMTHPRCLTTCILDHFFPLSHTDSTSCLYFLQLTSILLSSVIHTK